MTELLELLDRANPVSEDEYAGSFETVWQAVTQRAAAEASADRPATHAPVHRTARPGRRVALAAGVVVAVSVSLGVGLTGSGPQNAFAGWTAQPTQPTSGQLQAAETACEQSRPELASSSPAVADTRGPTSMLVYLEGDRNTVCATGESAFGTLVTLSAGAILSPAPNPGTITPHQLQVRVAADGQAFAALDGQVGAGVSAVTLVLDDGTSVQATVANGWFVAWWPENHGVQAAQITTPSGTSTQTLNGYSGAAPAVGGQNGPAGKIRATASRPRSRPPVGGRDCARQRESRRLPLVEQCYHASHAA